MSQSPGSGTDLAKRHDARRPVSDDGHQHFQPNKKLDARKGRPLHIASLPSHSYRTPCTPASSLAWPVPSRCLPPACAVIPHHHLPRSHADIADGAAAWPARWFSLVRSYARDLKLSLLHSSLFVGRMEPCLISGGGLEHWAASRTMMA